MSRTVGWLGSAALGVLLLAAVTASYGAVPAELLKAGVRVDLRDEHGTSLRVVNGTLVKAGVIVPIESLQGVFSAEIRSRQGGPWTTDKVLSVHSQIGLALLQMPEVPDYALSLPTDGSFMPTSMVTLVAGPGSRPDTVSSTAYYTFSLRGRAEFIAVSPGLAGAAPALDATGRLLGITGDLSDSEYSLGYLVPVVSVALLVGGANPPLPLSSLSEFEPEFLDRTKAPGLVFRGALLATCTKLEESRNFLNLAVKKDPTFPDAYYWLGRILFAEQQYAQAAELFQKAAGYDISFAMAWHMAGAAYNQAGRYADAEKMYLKAIEADPRSAGTYCNLWGAYVNLKEYDKAIAAARRSIELDPGYQAGLAYVNLAMTYAGMGRTDEAEKVYSDLQKVSPQSAQRLRDMLDGKKK